MQEKEFAIVEALTMFRVFLRHPLCDLHFTESRVYASPKGEMREEYSNIIKNYTFPYADILKVSLDGFSFRIAAGGKHWWDKSRTDFILTRRESAEELRTLLPGILALSGKLQVRK